MNRPEVRDAMLLIVRLVTGTIFIAHGWKKAFVVTLSQSGDQFQHLGIPFPDLAAALVSLGEMLGGAMLIVGILVPLAASWLALIMAGAMWYVHVPKGFFVTDGGLEYSLLLVVTMLTLVVFGAGRASLDYYFSRESDGM